MSGVAVLPVIKVLRQGDATKPDPFTIVIASNPALEAPWKSNTFVVDPITAAQPAFDACADYVVDSLFGTLPGQAEALLADPAIGPRVKIVSLFISGLNPEDSNSLVAQDGVSNIAIARRTVFSPFLGRYGLQADVAYAVTSSPTHTRASAWFTSDDDTRGGVAFSLDGSTYVHRYHHVIPGTIALPVTSKSLTALHEFGHALSSYTNGSIVDLYIDDGPGLNSKIGRPIPAGPASFSTYNGTGMQTDLTRDGLGYPAGWQSYHCELNDTAYPAVMDNYWLAGGGATPESCQHDKITRKFLIDRLLAKVSR
jgi:hypothetical protein